MRWSTLPDQVPRLVPHSQYANKCKGCGATCKQGDPIYVLNGQWCPNPQCPVKFPGAPPPQPAQQSYTPPPAAQTQAAPATAQMSSAMARILQMSRDAHTRLTPQFADIASKHKMVWEYCLEESLKYNESNDAKGTTIMALAIYKTLMPCYLKGSDSETPLPAQTQIPEEVPKPRYIPNADLMKTYMEAGGRPEDLPDTEQEFLILLGKMAFQKTTPIPENP